MTFPPTPLGGRGGDPHIEVLCVLHVSVVSLHRPRRSALFIDRRRPFMRMKPSASFAS